MSKIIKIKTTGLIEDENWVETTAILKSYIDIIDDLSEEDIQLLGVYEAKMEEAARTVMDTNNYVVITELKGRDDAVALVELDYPYTYEKIHAKRFFEEDGESFAEIVTMN